MGWASYLEDINRKLEEGLAAARERRGSHKPTIDNLSGKKLLRDLEALIGSASRELTRLENLIGIATDTDLNLSREVIALSSENERLRKIIKTFEGNSIGLAETYLGLVDEKNELEELIDRDLVNEFYDLDNQYNALKQRESALLHHEARLLERLKTQKQQYIADVEHCHEQIAKLEAELRKEQNLREILEIEVRKHKNSEKSDKARSQGSNGFRDEAGNDSQLSLKIRELEKKWK